jgi:hypothetical protein
MGRLAGQDLPEFEVRAVDDVKLFFPEELPDLIAEEARELWGV